MGKLRGEGKRDYEVRERGGRERERGREIAREGGGGSRKKEERERERDVGDGR